MFDKMFSRLAYNPSHLDSFLAYSKRLQRDKVLRKLSVYFMAGGIILMIFSFLNPYEKSVSYSGDNIINGIRTKADILTQWDNPQADIDSLYSKFGVTRQDIANLPDNPNTTINPSNPNNYWTTLRHLDKAALTTKDSQGITLDIDKKPYYMQPLDELSKSNTGFPAFKGRNSTTGQPFWVLIDTGGYTQIGNTVSKDAPPKPKLVIKKSYLHATPGLTGSLVVYEYRNTVPGTLAQDVLISDRVNPKMFGSIDTTDNARIDESGELTINLERIPFSQYSRRTIVRLTNDGTPLNLCSTLLVSSANAGNLMMVPKPDSCLAISPEIPTDSPDILVPSVSIRSNILARQNEDDEITDGTVSAGDVIEYKLTATNTSTVAIKDFAIADYVGDLLDYGDVDTNSLTLQGGQFAQQTKTINWVTEYLAPKSDTTKTFKLHLKNHLPTTNRPSLLNFSYDCRVSNTFGDNSSYKVNCPGAKNLENLPQIPQAIALVISLGMFLLMILFYLANVILSKEARQIKKTYQQKNHGK